MEQDSLLYYSILKSWEICSKNSVPIDIQKPIVTLTNEGLKKITEKKTFNIRL